MALVIDDLILAKLAAWMFFYAGVLMIKHSDFVGGILMGIGIAALIDIG